MVSLVVLFIICKHTKLKSLVPSLALQQIKEPGAVTKQKHFSILHDIECTCKILWYTISMFIISLLGTVVFLILNVRKLKLFRAYLFSNAVKIMLFITDAQYYVPIKICRIVSSMHLFKTTGKLLHEHVKLNKHILWDIMK